MSSFINLWNSKQRLIDEYVQLSKDADNNRELEANSAINAQRCFRGWQTRCIISHWSKCVVLIQRVYRGHVGRTISKNELSQLVSKQRIALYEYCASIIQKSFRGYYSRKYVHDFRARKAYIKRVVDTSSSLREKMQDHVEKLIQQDQEQKSNKETEEFEFITQNLHHLLSTATTPGIFNSPFQGAVTAMGLPVESHLKQAGKIYLKAKGIKSIRNHTHQVDRRSIQSSSRYNIVHEEEKKDSKFKKMKRLTNDDFIAGSIIGGLKGHQSSFTNGTRYMERWKAAMSTKAMNDLDKTNRIDSKPFFVAVNSGKAFDDILNNSVISYMRNPEAEESKNYMIDSIKSTFT